MFARVRTRTATFSLPAWLSDALALSAVALACSVTIWTFFGSYALDDSYIGFSIAQNAAERGEFAFNPGERVLTTSAPLVVPIYAAAQRFLRIDIVRSSQFLSALSILALGAGAYASVRRFASAAGATSSALIAVTSPCVTLLWSHESLMWLAAATCAVALYLSGRRTAGALLLGLATLLRPEALIAAAILAAIEVRRSGIRQALPFIALELAPYLIWSTYAVLHFGTILSQSLVAKHAQMRYSGYPYLRGLVHVNEFLYLRALGRPGSLVLPTAVVLAIVGFGALRAWRAPFAWVAAWLAAQTLLYVTARTHYFVWFGLQVPVAIAFVAALPWLKGSSCSGTMRRWQALARVIACLLVGLNVASACALATGSNLKYEVNTGLLVMPHVEDNAYYRLASWLRKNTTIEQSIAYPEIGQLRYYSGRRIVDDVGLATAGVAEQLRLGNGMWAFERYKPTVYIDVPDHWHEFVAPLEHAWFRQAYRFSARLWYPGTYRYETYDIYILRNSNAVPAPLVIDNRAHDSVHLLASAPDQIAFGFRDDRGGIAAADVRVRRRACAAPSISLTRGEQTIALRKDLPSARGIDRIRLDLPVPTTPSTEPYVLRVTGCKRIALSPNDRLKPDSIVIPLEREPGSAVDALTLYRRS
jgi:hypothetical protein